MLILAYFFIAASAHSRWVYPAKRPGENDLFGGVKTGPCGGYAPSLTRTSLTPGWNTLTFEETIAHTGAPWRISLGRSGGSENGFEDCILLNHIPHNDLSRTPQAYSINVFIPNVQCDHCVLQLANPMTDKITRGTYCDYDKTKLEQCAYGNTQCQAGVCFSNYHSCADVTITGTNPRDTFTCRQATQWPFRVGSAVPLPCNHANCRTAAQTSRDDYTQISVTWTNGKINDLRVPAIFSQELVSTTAPETTTNPEMTTTAPETTKVTPFGAGNGSASTSDDGAIAAGVVVPLVLLLLLGVACWYYRDNIAKFLDGQQSGTKQTSNQGSVPMSIQAPSAVVENSEWHYIGANQQSVGPISQKDFESRVGKQVTGETLVWKEGMPEWKPAKEVRTVKRLLDSSALTGSRRVAPPLPPPGGRRPVKGRGPVGDPATANVEWQYVNANADSVPILEKDLIKLKLPGDTYVWNGSTVNDWTYMRDTYLWKWQKWQ